MRSMRLQVLLLAAACSLAGAGVLTVSANRGSATPPSPAPATASPPAAAATSPGPSEPEPPAATVAPSPPDLGARLNQLLTDPALAGVTLGLSLRDQDGALLVDLAASQPLLPASTSKLVTAAAALGRLGPSFRFRTHVMSSTGPGSDGVLHGDLVLVGGGDPTLATETYRTQVSPQRPSTALEALADQLVARGVQRVTGDLLADATVFAHQPVAPGWRERYVTELDATHVSGLTVDGGRKLFVEHGKLQAVASPDPASEAAAALLTALRQRGVQVDGGITRVDQPTGAALTLAAVDSPPLDELLRWLVQRSDNHMADAVFRTLGAVAGDATWAGAEAAARAAMAPLALSWHGVRLADGSGLSRENRMPADFLTTLDAAISRAGTADRWASWQAVAGNSGTLKRRLRGTVAEGRMRGKTGSLEDVRALSGSVEGPAGQRIHFTLLANQVPRAARPAVRHLQDEVVLAIAEYLHHCVRIPASGDLKEDAPPYQLSCAA